MSLNLDGSFKVSNASDLDLECLSLMQAALVMPSESLLIHLVNPFQSNIIVTLALFAKKHFSTSHCFSLLIVKTAAPARQFNISQVGLTVMRLVQFHNQQNVRTIKRRIFLLHQILFHMYNLGSSK